MKLSERLELKRDVWRGTEFGDDICELLDEAAELARRVEGAPVAVAGASPGRFYYAAGSDAVEHGQRVRLVPDDPTPPDPTPQEVPDA